MELSKEHTAIVAAMNEYGVIFDNEPQQPRRIAVSHYAIYKDVIGGEHVVFIPHIKKFNTHGHAYITIQKIHLSEEGVPVLQNMSKLGMLILAGFNTPEEAIRKYNERGSAAAGVFIAVGPLACSEETVRKPTEFNTFEFTPIAGHLTIEAACDELVALANIVKRTHDVKSAKQDKATLKNLLNIRRDSMNAILKLVEDYIEQIPS